MFPISDFEVSLLDSSGKEVKNLSLPRESHFSLLLTNRSNKQVTVLVSVGGVEYDVIIIPKEKAAVVGEGAFTLHDEVPVEVYFYSEQYSSNEPEEEIKYNVYSGQSYGVKFNIKPIEESNGIETVKNWTHWY